jgi:hypothetical protein
MSNSQPPLFQFLKSDLPTMILLTLESDLKSDYRAPDPGGGGDD